MSCDALAFILYKADIMRLNVSVHRAVACSVMPFNHASQLHEAFQREHRCLDLRASDFVQSLFERALLVRPDAVPAGHCPSWRESSPAPA